MPVNIDGIDDIGDTGGIHVQVKEEIYDRLELRTNDSLGQDDPSRLKRLMTNMQVIDEVSVIKSSETARTDPQEGLFTDQGELQHSPQPTPPADIRPESSFSLSSLYPNMFSSNSASTPDVSDVPAVPAVQEVTSREPELDISVKRVENDQPEAPAPETPAPETPAQEAPKSPRKDMVVIHGDNDIDDTSSMANFFNDIKSIAENKGIKVETNKDNNFTLFEDANEVEVR